MQPIWIVSILTAYFVSLLSIAYFTSRNAQTTTFFNADKQSPWYLVAFGMIGASLSGVTFISIPGAVLLRSFGYFQVVLGYIAGYLVIALVLMPLYYRLNLISIYTYLETRFGRYTYKTGASFFLLSRTIGTAFRLFLAVEALQIGLFGKWEFPFWLTTAISIALIWLYTFRGGIKTIVWTDTFQTSFLLLALFSAIGAIKQDLSWDFENLVTAISESPLSQIFFWNNFAENKYHFVKQFLAGMFIAIAMTGLDQDLMQKNLTCKNLREAQKNMFSFVVILVAVNFVFLVMGALLYLYAENKAITLPSQNGKILTDQVYPVLAFEHLGGVAGIAFLLGITAATYASSDSALASLTTSFCIDFLGLTKKSISEQKAQTTVRWVHLGFSVLLLAIVVIFEKLRSAYPQINIIGALFQAAGYTYGALLGLFAFGITTQRNLRDKLVPWVCVICPLLTFGIAQNSAQWFGYLFGDELILLNGLLNYAGLWVISVKK
ncbi:MAG: sodium:solute symporter [Raineya sp.]|nr:sodium:solute symporter [Raineya sp.]MDW8297602.1 sodium:solute symporter [Raineya sp.]